MHSKREFEKIPASYLVGMKGFNEFFELLFDAIHRTCPGILLSNTAGFGWRGFRIDHYKNLPLNQFFCQVDTANPKVVYLKEIYYDRCYHFPWQLHPVFDLELNGFFELGKLDQRHILVDFFYEAMQHAMTWQESDERKLVVGSAYLHGHEAPRNPIKMRAIYDRIPREYVHSTLIQNRIFHLLKEAIREEIAVRMNRRVVLEPNANWYNWEFRGLRMKICDEKGEKPSGPWHYRWCIYYRRPAVIRFETENRQYEIDLTENGFFSLNLEEQVEWLELFVRQALDLVSPSPIEII